MLAADSGAALQILDGGVSFISGVEGGAAVGIEIILEPTSILTNFKIKYWMGEEARYLVRRGGRVVSVSAEEETKISSSNKEKDKKDSEKRAEGKEEVDESSIWIFVPVAIDEEHTFVIARYSEDASWARFLPGRVIIYNKGKNNIDFEMRNNVRIQTLENIGREGHTYLHHMIENYNNLSERTTFLQANPFTHSENIIEICCMGKDMADFQAISMYYLPGLPRADIFLKYCKRLNGAGHTLFPVDKFGQFFDFCDSWWRPASDRYAFGKNPLTEFLRLVGLSHKCREIYLFCMAALFSVRRENILLNTRDVYEKMIVELTARNIQGGFDGYILERLWHTILTGADSAYKIEGDLIPALFGQKELCYYTNSRATTLKKWEGAFKNFKLVPYPRFIFPESDFVNHIKNYSSIVSHQLHRRGSEFTIMANLGCRFVDEEMGAGVVEERLTKYFEYLVHHIGEWDLFLGAPRNINPVRIVCENPYIIECCYATDLTFAIHSLNSVRIIQDYSLDSSKYTKNLDLALVDGLIARGYRCSAAAAAAPGAEEALAAEGSERSTKHKIWIPYPVLCENADDGERGDYIATINNELATFIKRAKERKVLNN